MSDAGEVNGAVEQDEKVDALKTIHEIGLLNASDAPDRELQMWLKAGDLASEYMKFNPFWALNSALWEYGMKTAEYKNFVEENKDNFTRAFWGEFANGVKLCMGPLMMN